jgi:hypothetical protein
MHRTSTNARTYAFFVCVTALFTLTLLPGGAVAQGNPISVYLVREVPPQYVAGQPVQIVVQIYADGIRPDTPLSALGVIERVPPGWQYLGMQDMGQGTPQVPPRGGVEQLEFAWINPPQQFPYAFSYTLGVPPNEAGNRYISGQVLYRLDGPELQSPPELSEITARDTGAPRIVLNGDTAMEWPLRTPFVDPGYTATDSVDGDITGRVRVTGYVDVNNQGTYTLTYTVNDSNGNAAVPQIRTVAVVPGAPEPPPGGGNHGGGSGGVGSGGGGPVFGLGPNGGMVRGGNEKAAKRASGRHRHKSEAQRDALAAQQKKAAANNKTAKQHGFQQPGVATPKPLDPRAVNGAVSTLARRMVENTLDPGAGTDNTAPLQVASANPGAMPPPPRGANTAGAPAPVPALAATSAPAINTAAEETPGVWARLRDAFNGMSTMDYARLGAMAIIFLLIVGLAAFAFRFAYSPGPRRPLSKRS